MTTTQTPRTPRRKPTTPPRVDPWERQPAETDPAWAAFKTYRDMGLTRSLAKVASELGKSTPLMEGWSRKHSWVVRANAYDTMQDREWLLEQKVLRRKAQKRNATTSALAMQKFGEFLMNLDPESPRLLPSDMAALARVALAAEKAALDMPDSVNVRVGAAQGAVDADTIAGLTDEERQARLRMLVREATARLEDPDAVHDGLHEEDDDG